MSVNLRLPSISGAGANDHERLRQMERYLFSLVEQLQFALGAVGEGSSGTTVMPTTVNKSETIVVGDKFDKDLAFSQLKELIIGSADIKKAYYDEFTTEYNKAYVAISDFGSFVEKATQRIDINAENIDLNFSKSEQIFTDIRTENFASIEAAKELLNGNIDSLGNNISNDINGLKGDLSKVEEGVNNLNYSLIEVTANIKTGIVDKVNGEIPVYGIEIGQQTWLDGEEVYKKFARFTSGRLSFYDQNGTEVAYISDFKLYIRSAEIVNSQKLGGYIDVVKADGGVVTKWVGGSNG